MNTLYIVATPIGNLADISSRAIETLKNVDLIFAEDTRRTGKLLSHFDIPTRTQRYHEHNVVRALPKVLAVLESGDVALVSDSGTPLISDPGFKLVREVVAKGFNVISIPGASAVLTALVVSGLPTDKFSFRGFLPKKLGKFQKELEYVSDCEETIIYFESPYRILKTVKQVVDVLGVNRQIAVVRELTKMNEEVLRGTSEKVYVELSKKSSIKGEIVLVIAKASFENA